MNQASNRLSEPSLAPSIVTSGDQRYDDLRVSNNSRWTGTPDDIVLVGEGTQVAGFVQKAVDAKRQLSVRSGGHCYTDFVLNGDVRSVLDLSRLDDVYYDHRMRAFAVEPGGVLLETYKKLYRGWGVTIPGGMCYSVGTGGHVIGAGYGLLARTAGNTADHLRAVEVVCVNGRGRAHTVRATSDPDDPHHDLWWAHTGGGGGNFGIVTKFWFRTPELPASSAADTLMTPPRAFLVSILGIPWESLDEAKFTHLVDQFGQWHEEHSSSSQAEAGLCSFLMMNHRSNGSIGLLTVIDADIPNAHRIIDDFVARLLDTGGIERQELRHGVGELGPIPGFAEPKEVPWLHAMTLLGTNNPTLTSPQFRADHKSAYLKKRFSAEQVSAMYASLTDDAHENPQSMVVLLSYGGRINDVARDATASVQRDSIFKGLFQSFWEGQEHDAENIAWTRNVYTTVFGANGGYPVPGDETDGCFINYPDADIRDAEVNRSGVPWSELYYGENYARLVAVKEKYDPLDVFKHSQSIGS